jgi:hypothetical protein
MHKGDYLAQAPVQHFTEWLAGVLCGQPIDFWYGANPQQMDATLAQSLARYAWPVAALQNIQLREPAWGFPAPIWQIGLERYATLQANEDVLHTLQVGLRAAMSQNDQDQDLKAWMAAVMIWGGVYQGGNRNWLHAHAGSLHDVLSETCLALSAGNDEIVLNPPIVFRFNAAMTKVYSLLLHDFIIYDSRVAAALSWLVQKWWLAQNNVGAPPALLRVACMNARQAANAPIEERHIRRVPGFPGINNNPHTHARWNLRANWIIKSAFDLASSGRSPCLDSLRKIEAGLFTIGYDLRYSLSNE